MLAEFRNTLRRQRGNIIGWGIGLFLYSLMMALFFPSLQDMFGDLNALLNNYPKEFLAFFPSIMQMGTPAGYMDTYYYSYMTLIIGIYAVGAFSGLLTRQEEQGVLDLLLAQPVSRTAMFWGRVLGITVSTALILLIGWLGWQIPAQRIGFDLTLWELLAPNLPLLAVLMFFGALGLLFSMLLPASRLAGGLAGALLVGNYLITGLSSINPDLQSVFKLTPLKYYQGGLAVGGLNWGWVLGLLGAALIPMLLAWLLFNRRDIRVGGERSFQLSAFNPFRKQVKQP